METSLSLSIIYGPMLEQPQEVPEDDRSLTAYVARDRAAKIVSGALQPGSRLLQDQVASGLRFPHAHADYRDVSTW